MILGHALTCNANQLKINMFFSPLPLFFSFVLLLASAQDWIFCPSSAHIVDSTQPPLSFSSPLFLLLLLLLLFFPPQRMLKSIESNTHVYTLPHYCRRVCKITPTVSSLTRSNVSSRTQEHASMRTHKHKHKHTRTDTHTHTHTLTHTHTHTNILL